MSNQNKKWYLRGLKDGLPISMGYFAVAFTLGIAARNAGLSALQATLTSLMINASAGQYAGFTLIAAGAGYLEVALMALITNARYLLMSCALSQKLSADTPLFHRMLVGFDVTDEIFGVSVSVPDKLNPFYNYGMMTISIPGWASGTFFGVIMGNVLPVSLVSALSVGLYGMFLAVIVPPARGNRVLAGVIGVSMVMSFAFSKITLFRGISSGMQIILLTVLIAGAAAFLFPLSPEGEKQSPIGEEAQHAT